jgi:hypothetical protein
MTGEVETSEAKETRAKRAKQRMVRMITSDGGTNEVTRRQPVYGKTRREMTVGERPRDESKRG